MTYCKTRFLLHPNFAILESRNFTTFDFTFSQHSTGIYEAFDGQTEFWRV